MDEHSIEDLIAQVDDPVLRRRLAAEGRTLKRRQKFGLVYEEQEGEWAVIPGLPVEVGAVVQDRTSSPDARFRVLAVRPRTAQLEPLRGGDPETRPLKHLQVVKVFGDPTYTALQPLSAVRRSQTRPAHAVISGENFHALQTLLYLYEGKAAAVYIDPPYNTGTSAWKYNNRFVDESDTYKHSKWLSFMERRLRLAKRLLKQDGVLVCTIDEHEVHRLALLLGQVFKGYSIYTVNIVYNPKGTNEKNFARVDEYAIFCVPDGAEPISGLPGELFAQARSPEHMAQLAESESETEMLYLRRRGQESGHRRHRPNQFYAILVNEETREVVGLGPALRRDDPYKVTRKGKVVTVYPLDTRGEERVWRYQRDTMQQYVDRGEIVVSGRSSRAQQGWVLNHRVVRKPERRLKTVWWEKRHDAGASGADVLTAYLGDSARFPFPKAVYAVRDCLAAITRDQPDALIVDFFAGSGTTFHATCLLNAEDGGRRRSVMVTNNEVEAKVVKRLAAAGSYVGDPEFERHGIFESVTKPRVEAVVTGRRANGEPVPGEHVWAGRRPYADGFQENVEFFRLDYLNPDHVDIGWQFAAVLPALWLRSGAVGERPVPPASTTKSFLPKGCNFGVLFDPARAREFAAACDKRPDVVHLYLVCDSTETFAEMRALMPGRCEVSMLYSDFLRNFEINSGRWM